MKKYLLTTALVSAGFAAAMAATPAAAQTQVAWGGSNPGGVMYYMVGVAGTLFSEQVDGLNVTQVTTGGSTENAKRLVSGELDMGIVYGAHVYMSLNNEGPFENDPTGDMLRGVAKAYEGPTYFVTLEGSDIETIDDLAGANVALGPPGSGTVFNCSNMLRALGMLEDIDPEMMTFADAGRALGNNQIDAFCQSSAPAAAVSELAETQGVRVLEYSDEQMATIQEMYPFYNTGQLADDVYTGVPETQMPFMTVYWVAHERVDADVVEDMLEVAYTDENRQRLAEGHAAWAQMEPDTANFLALGAPMHPGAEAYYQANDMWEE